MRRKLGNFEKCSAMCMIYITFLPEKNMAWVEKRAYFGFHFPALREPIASVGLNYWPHWQVNTKSGLD